MYQIIRRILENPNDKNTKIWLIYGNKTEKDILLKQELDTLEKEHADRLKIKYVLESPPSDSTYEKGFITQKMIEEMMIDDEKKSRRKIFVCGPNKMLELVSGERARDYSQGQVTGILSNLGLSSNEIWKFQ
jgi:cytochrome-b5 reductase